MRRLLIAAVAGTLAIVAACAGNGSKQDATPVPTTSPFISQPTGGSVGFSSDFLATTNRDHLSFCLNRFPKESVSSSDIDKLGDAVLAVHRSLDGYNAMRRYLETHSVKPDDCPAPAVPFGKGPISKYDAGEYARKLAIPSVHRVFVYFVSPDVYAATFGKEPYVVGAAEMLCLSGDNCAEVTTAVYVPANVDEAALAAAVSSVL